MIMVKPWTVLPVGVPAQTPEPGSELAQQSIFSKFDQSKLISPGLGLGKEGLLTETLLQDATDLAVDPL